MAHHPGHLTLSNFGNALVDPNWAPPTPARNRAVLPSTVIAIIMLSVVVISALGLTPRTFDVQTSATRYLPTGTVRIRLTNPADGTTRVDEWVSGHGMQVFQTGPGALLYASSTADELLATDWVRLSSQLLATDGSVREERVSLVANTPRGLELRVSIVGSMFTAYPPGHLLLPATVKSGDQWSSDGRASLGTNQQITSRQDYRASSTATAAPDGCLLVSNSHTVGVTTTNDQATWCPERGIIAVTDSAGTRQLVAGSVPWATASAGRAVDNTIFDWTKLGGQPFTREDYQRPGILPLTPRVAPAVLPDGVAVFANEQGSDLAAVKAGDPSPNPLWRAHPGGLITNLLALGRVVVATTSERRIVAYGDRGQWLWEADTEDLAEAALVRLGDLVIVATVDGSVSAYRVENGELAWRTSMPNEVRLSPVVRDNRLYVFDQAGNLRGFDAAGAQLLEFATNQPDAFAVGASAIVVSYSADEKINAFALDDGRQLWSIRVRGTRQAMAEVGGSIVLRQGDALIGLDPMAGGEVWRRPGGTTAWWAGGEQLLILDASTIRLLGPTGGTLASWPTQETQADDGAGAWFVAGNGTVAFFHGRVGYLRAAR